jgi:serine/threonine protein kinase
MKCPPTAANRKFNMPDADAKPEDLASAKTTGTPPPESRAADRDAATGHTDGLIEPSLLGMGSTRTYAAATPHKERHGSLRVEDLKLDPSLRAEALGRMKHYEILEFVGCGAMGIVLKAFDEQLHRQVAIKVMSPDLISRPTARERFFREARAAAGISHPNVVTIHAVSEHRGLPYLVMEFVDGLTLAD